ncbi:MULTISPECIES: LysE family translocator [unclassified Pseudomonas]|uniref:LysE family translocator n=1 Tax=unclassified Pseudomonas TaxID=196821 RepID=UPI00244D2690|nr:MULTISPECIES: LysE family translocator [unclassified Pseudomonas]MDH0895765.1 LysE family translocator [Pseudomonas sp. GD03875]MDH1066587.1 LysE family translocator [Pseudomonas sp. GD03985]
MLGTHDLALFIVSGLLLNMAPGPDSLLVMARSASQGWRAGSMAALGIGAGTCVHIVAAALGMSALLATSATAFMLVKLVGAAYLLYIGIGMLLTRRRDNGAVADALPPLSHGRIFAQGFLTNVLNPKVALFFLAFVPQFIHPDAEHKALAFLLLGAIFNVNGMLWCHFLALSTVFARQRLRIGRGLGLWLERGVGGVLALLGVKLALADRA